MADDIARLGYEIDSSQALGAAKNLLQMESAAGAAAGAASKLETTFRRSNGQFQSAAGFAADHADEIKRLASQYNTTLSAQLRYADAQRDVARAVQLGVISADQQDAVLERLQSQYMATGNAARNMQASVGNQFAQMNDVVVSAWGGMSPALIGMQQGMQIVQGFAGQSLPQALKTMGGAFMTLLSPTTLLTVGLIAGGAALVQWGSSALQAGGDADSLTDKMDDLSGSIDDFGEIASNVRRTLGDLTMEFGSLADEMQIAFSIMERAKIRDIEKDFRNISSAVTDQVGITDLAKQSLRGFTGERAEVEAIADIFGITVGHAYNLMENLNAVENAADFEDMASKAADLLAIIEATQGPVENLDGPFAVVADRLAELVALAGQYRAEAEATVDAVGNAIPSGVDPGIRPQMRPMDLGDPGPDKAGARRAANRAKQLAKQRERELETLISSLMTERETIDAWQKEQLALLAQYNDAELAAIGGKEEAKNRILQEAADKRAAIVQGERDRSLGIYSDLMGNMASLAQAGGEKTFAVWKAFSIAQATIDSYRAYTQVLADPFFIGRPFMRAIAAGSVLAGGLAQVANIASTNIGGGGGGKGSSAAATTGSSASAASPERVVRIDLRGGTARDREFAESIISQIYEASEDGARVVVAR